MERLGGVSMEGWARSTCVQNNERATVSQGPAEPQEVTAAAGNVGEMSPRQMDVDFVAS